MPGFLAWISGNAKVYGDAEVYGNAKVYGNAWISDYAKVYGYAEVYGNAWISDWQADTWAFKFVDPMATGPTPLIAAMRCYVRAKLGDEINIPEELL